MAHELKGYTKLCNEMFECGSISEALSLFQRSQKPSPEFNEIASTLAGALCALLFIKTCLPGISSACIAMHGSNYHSRLQRFFPTFDSQQSRVDTSIIILSLPLHCILIPIQLIGPVGLSFRAHSSGPYLTSSMGTPSTTSTYGTEWWANSGPPTQPT
eukprot:1161094-Pelagomonas_calceolata.AAC.2